MPERDWWAIGLPNPCHRRDPRLLLWRIRHRLTGPRRGCSCSRCFRHPKRIPRSNEVIDRFVRLERRIEQLENAARDVRRRAYDPR